MYEDNDISQDDDSQEQSDWELRDPLDSRLSEREGDADLDQPPTRLTVRAIPVGFRSAIQLLARMYRLSPAADQRISTKFGMSILKDEPRYKSLTELVREVSRERLGSADVELLDDLEFTGRFLPTHTRPIRVDFSLYWRVHRDLTEVAFDLGLPMSHVVILCCYMSLVTVESLGSYWKMMDEDLDRFWRYLERRRKQLEG